MDVNLNENTKEWTSIKLLLKPIVKWEMMYTNFGS